MERNTIGTILSPPKPLKNILNSFNQQEVAQPFQWVAHRKTVKLCKQVLTWQKGSLSSFTLLSAHFYIPSSNKDISIQLFCCLLSSQIFDYFVPRLGDTHKKVKQKALDVLAEIIGILKDGLNPVIIRLVEGITNNLNSKVPGVYAAAVKALEESMAHLGKAEPWHGLSSTVSLPLRVKRTLSALTAVVVCGNLQLTPTRSCAGAVLTHQSPNRLECASAFPKSARSPWLCAACLKRKCWTTALLEFGAKGIFGVCLGPIWLPKWIALLLAWRDTGASEPLQSSLLEGSTL